MSQHRQIWISNPQEAVPGPPGVLFTHCDSCFYFPRLINTAKSPRSPCTHHAHLLYKGITDKQVHTYHTHMSHTHMSHNHVHTCYASIYAHGTHHLYAHNTHSKQTCTNTYIHTPTTPRPHHTYNTLNDYKGYTQLQ